MLEEITKLNSVSYLSLTLAYGFDFGTSGFNSCDPWNHWLCLTCLTRSYIGLVRIAVTVFNQCNPNELLFTRDHIFYRITYFYPRLYHSRDRCQKVWWLKKRSHWSYSWSCHRTASAHTSWLCDWGLCRCSYRGIDP